MIRGMHALFYSTEAEALRVPEGRNVYSPRAS